MKIIFVFFILISCSVEENAYDFNPVVNNDKAFTSQVIEEINFYRDSLIVESNNELTFYLAYQHSKRGVLDHEGYYYRLETIRNYTSYNFASEIMAYGFENPKELVFAWLNSELHRDAILKNYKEITIAKHGQYVTALLLK